MELFFNFIIDLFGKVYPKRQVFRVVWWVGFGLLVVVFLLILLNN